jgi:hypothetical protein
MMRDGMSSDARTYTVEASCYASPIEVRWRDGMDALRIGREMLRSVRELSAALQNSTDPYAQAGLRYLAEYAVELETWVPQLPGDEAMTHVIRAICVLRGLWGEIDRVEGRTINELVQRISFDAQAALEEL